MAGKYSKSKRPSGTGRAAWLITLLMLFGLLGMTGCGHNPTAPDTTANVNLAAGGPDASAPDASPKVFAFNHRTAYGSGWVSPRRGGSIDLNWGSSKNQLIVPPHAVNKRMFIEVRTSFTHENQQPGQNFFEFEFSPDGTQFNTPATLVIQARALNRIMSDGGVIKLYWFNPETGVWEVEQSARVHHGRVEFRIAHFSKFGVSD
jgi:hypothetical protein